MKGNQKRIISLTMVLQIFVISFAIMAIPAAAEEPLPSIPITLKGDVKLDGEPAPVGTAIYVELNGEKASGTIIVRNEGEYSLPVKCSSGDYSNLIFYVNDIEAKLVDATVLEIINDEAVRNSVDLVAISPVDADDDGTGGSGGSSSGGSSTTTTSDSDDGNPSGSIASVSSTGGDDTSLKSVAATTQPESTEDVPAPKTKTSMVVIVIGAIILIGIVVIVGYKLKEN